MVEKKSDELTSISVVRKNYGGKHNKLYIVGASGHGKVVADIAKCIGCYKEILFLDDDIEKTQCGQYRVIADTKYVDKIENDNDVIVAIGNMQIREGFVCRLLRDGMNVPILIHPQAVVAEDVEIGQGTVVMAGAVVNSGVHIGRGVIVNTSSSVDHDCQIGNFTHVSVGAHLAGTVSVGDRVWVGAGAIINNNLTIHNDCMIGSGAVVVKNINEEGTYIGVPAKRM